MKTIYISHSHKMNYEEELYRPLLNSKISNLYKLIFPHSSEYDKVNTKDILIHSDLLIAEVSYVGIGIGMELGRAECNNIPIICIIKKGIKCSSSVKRNYKVIEYLDEEDMIKKLEELLLK